MHDPVEDVMGKMPEKDLSYIERRRGRLATLPGIARRNNVSPEHWTAMTDIILDLTGTRPLADQNDMEDADRVLAEAHRTVETAIAFGVLAPEGLERLGEWWEGSWQCKAAAKAGQPTTPSFGHIKAVLKDYTAAGWHLTRATKALPPDECDFDSVFVLPEMDVESGRPRKSRRRTK